MSAMDIDFSRLFHASSKDLSGGGTVNIPADEKEGPEDWTAVHYKEYPRFPAIALPERKQSADFFELVKHRSSRRDFSGKPIQISDLSVLLKYSYGITEDPKEYNPRRAAPSGGGRYPL